jgi:hypothetical protein
MENGKGNATSEPSQFGPPRHGIHRCDVQRYWRENVEKFIQKTMKTFPPKS